MAFADSAHAHDHPQLAGLRAGLVGVDRERRVEVGSGLEGVLLSEVGTDQGPSCGGCDVSCLHQSGDGGVVLLQVTLEIAMTRPEVGEGLLQCRDDLILREPHAPIDELACTGCAPDEFLFTRDEESAQDPVGIPVEDDVGAFDDLH